MDAVLILKMGTVNVAFILREIRLKQTEREGERSIERERETEGGSFQPQH